MPVKSVPQSPPSVVEPAGPAIERTGDISGTVSTRIVGFLRDHAGRGPTKARTATLPDLVVVTVSDCLTRPERTLVENGDVELTAKVRSALYHAIRPQAIATIEDLTGRQVAAYLTDQHFDPDVAIVAFALGPATPLHAA